MTMSQPPILDPTTDTPPRRRRWILLSLRMFVTFLVLAGLASVFWIGVPAYCQHQVIREIERLGGTVDSVNAGPTWLRKFVGAERMLMFDEIVTVRLVDTQATDATLRRISRLRHLRWLNMDNNTQVTDSGLVHLKGMASLEWLHLDNMPITDTGLAHLSHMPKPWLISLDGTRVTKAGVDNWAPGHVNGYHILGGP